MSTHRRGATLFCIGTASIVATACSGAPDAATGASSGAAASSRATPAVTAGASSGSAPGAAAAASSKSGHGERVLRTAQADTQAKDNPDTFTGAAKTLVDWTGAVANVYGTFQAGQAILQAFGILKDPNQDVLDELRALYAQINAVAGNVSWYMAESDREARLSDLRTAVFTTHDTVSSGARVDWYTLDLNTAQRVGEGTDPTAFERYYDDSQTNGASVYDFALGGFTWKSVIGYTKEDLGYDHGYVHDWRLGLPSLMQLIGLRLQLMAMEDPNFTTDRRFPDELTSYHDILKNELDRMNAGVRSNVIINRPNYDSDLGPVYGNWTFWVSCADIYSGLNDTRNLVFGDSYPLNTSSCVTDDGSSGSGVVTYDPACLTQAGIDYNNWYQANVQAVQDQECANVRQKMPLFGTQALIDTLYLFANGLTDLTRADSTIHVSANPGLCLDVPWGSTAQGTQVQIYSCNGDPTSQSWKYDRLNQQLVNTNSGLCLDVQWANSAAGTPVWTWPCNGTAAQRWTYDPQYHVLANGVGTVLDVPSDNLQPNQLLWTSGWSDSDGQRWQ